MKREIKFRAFRTDGGEWIYGLPEYCPKYKTIRFFTAILENGCVEGISIKPNTVGQFTELIDKNEIDIYDGDLCKCNGEIYEIKMTQRGGAWKAININSPNDDHFLLHVFHQVEVISNIHESATELKEE